MLTISSTLQQVIDNDNVWPVKLLDLQIGEVTYRISDHYKNISMGIDTYLANGNLVSIDSVMHDIDSSENTLEIGLSGINSAFRRDVIEADSIGGNVTVYRGFIDESTGELVEDAHVIFEGVIFQVSVSENYPMDIPNSPLTQESFSVTAEVRSTNFLLQEVTGRSTNNESNMRVDPTDLSMEFVEGLNGRNLRFGGTE